MEKDSSTQPCGGRLWWQGGKGFVWTCEGAEGFFVEAAMKR